MPRRDQPARRRGRAVVSSSFVTLPLAAVLVPDVALGLAAAVLAALGLALAPAESDFAAPDLAVPVRPAGDFVVFAAPCAAADR